MRGLETLRSRPALSTTRLHAAVRVGLLCACANRPEWESLRATELSALLKARGVDTTGIFERDELLRLLAEPPRASREQLPSIDGMRPREIMEELDRRGVRFDVLAPPQKLSQLLVRARERSPLQAPAPVWPAPPWPAASAPPAAPVPPPAAPVPAAAAEPAPPPPAAEPAAAQTPEPPADAPPSVPAPEASVARDLLPVPEMLPLLRGAGAFLSTTLGEAGPALSQVTSKAGPALRNVPRAVQDGTGRLGRRWALSRRAKAMLLVVCVCALRFGLVRTVLIAVSLKLSQELAVSVLPGRKDAEGPPPRARPQAS